VSSNDEACFPVKLSVKRPTIFGLYKPFRMRVRTGCEFLYIGFMCIFRVQVSLANKESVIQHHTISIRCKNTEILVNL